MNHVVLYQPEIPQNTGNIARTCVATGTPLHLIKPYGFSLEDKYVKRAGLDYWKDLELYEYDSIEEFFNKNKGSYYMISKFGKKNFTDMDYSNADDTQYFIFGRETKGLPDWLKDEYEESLMRIPMTDKVRSLNLSNTVSILIYEALRQQEYPGLK